jgi:predicted acetyltransferase
MAYNEPPDTPHWSQQPMPIELLAASREQQPVLANLLELYAHDFSELMDVPLGDDGRFGYPRLRLYWEEPNRFPFLVRSGTLAGFALVKRGSEVSGDETVWDMAEMFVVRGMRRRGIGTQVAHEVWRRLPGAWEVRVMQANAAALPFWARAIGEFVGREIIPACFERLGKAWNVFAFESRAS